MTEYVLKLKDSLVFVNSISLRENAVSIETGKRDEKALVFTSLADAFNMCALLNNTIRFSSYVVAARNTKTGKYLYCQLD